MSIQTSYRRWWATTGRSAETLRNYGYTLTRLADRLGGEDRLIEATRDDLEAFLADRMTEVGPATVSNDFRALRSFYTWLYNDEEITVNPAAKLRGPKVRRDASAGVRRGRLPQGARRLPAAPSRSAGATRR